MQWVSDGSPSHSHATKIENNNQFVPVNTNPKEFKKVQKLVRRKLSFREASAKDNVLDERGPSIGWGTCRARVKGSELTSRKKEKLKMNFRFWTD